MGNSASCPVGNAGPPPNEVTCCRQSYRTIYGSAKAVLVINLFLTPILFGISITTPPCFIPAVLIMLIMSSYIYTQSKNLGDRMNVHLNNSQLAFSIIVACFGIIGGSLEFSGYMAFRACSTMSQMNDNHISYNDHYTISNTDDPMFCLINHSYAWSNGWISHEQYMDMARYFGGVIISSVNFLFIMIQIILLSCTCAQVWKEASRQAKNTDLENGVRNVVVKEGAQVSPVHGTIQNTAQYNPAQATPSQMPMSSTYGQQNMMNPPAYTPPPTDLANMPVDTWTKNDVCKWLEQEQLETLTEPFRSNSIDGLAMSSLTQKELDQMNLPIGRVKKFLSARERLLLRKVHPTQ